MKTLVKLAIILGLMVSLVGCGVGPKVKVIYGDVQVKSINGVEVGK